MLIMLRLRKFPSKTLSSFVLLAGALIGCLAASVSLTAQEAAVLGAQPLDNSASVSVPSAPADPSSTSAPAPQNPSTLTPLADSPPPPTKRILGIVPNFRAVNADVKLPPQTVKQKFMGATQDSFDYSSVFVPAVLAGYGMATDATPEFQHGAAGYGRYFWHAAVDQTSENYWVEFIFPALTHEDSRYYTLGRGGFVKRSAYALTRAVITRSDSGSEVFNVSEVFGSGAASGLSTLYYPARERSLANTGQEWGLDVGIDAASFWVREFWPEINRSILRNRSGNPPAQQ